MTDASASPPPSPLEPAAARRATVTACIIARDEERRLADCLAAVGFCDEVVVVDSGSSDATVALARAAGAVVVEQPWLGFAGQRNVAIDAAGEDWILEVDADERVSPALRQEIEAFLADPPPGIELGGLPIRDVFLSRALGPSAKHPKYRHRFFARGSYRHDERRTVHEGLVPRGEVHPFGADIVHLLAEDWREALADVWTYARLEAGQLEATRSLGAIARGAVLRPGAKFFYRLLVDGGWRDGKQGCARIALECAGDTLVWIRHAARLRGDVRGRSGVPLKGHFGAWTHRQGTVRVIGVAAGPRAARRAAGWLQAARADGCDATLLTDARMDAGSVRVHRVGAVRPVVLIRALTGEDQLRTADVVLGFGPWARTVLRAVPRGLRGAVHGLDERARIEAVARAAHEAREAA